MNNYSNHWGHNRFLSGVFLIGAGLLVLLFKLGAPIPSWIITWPMLLIAIGVFNGLKNGFQNPSWLVLIFIGSVFLVEKVVPEVRLREYIIPILLIGVGAFYIVRPRKSNKIFDFTDNNETGTAGAADFVNLEKPDAETIEINSILGGAKRVVVSKNFQGGEVNCFFGGAEVYLQQADIQGIANIEVNCVFGGGKIVVPTHWEVKIIATNIMGGVNDKRQINGIITQAGKVLIIKANCVFGGLEISNY